MNLLNQEIPCTLHFLKNDETKESSGMINPYTGSIKHKFSGNNVSHITFKYDSNEYNFETYTLGGRYFIKKYESSPFYRLFILQKKLIPKSAQQSKKLKI